MTDPSLYDAGWRQGTVTAIRLDAVTIIVEGDDLRRAVSSFDLWVIASQDCDLARLPEHADEALVELRPATTGDPGTGWGLRSRSLRLTADTFVDSDLPRLMVSPRLLTLHGRAARRPPLVEGRATAFKTWLGLRYDRPAVPELFVELAKAIALAVRRTRTSALADAVHDVLMQFEGGVPPRFALYAVVTEEALAAQVEAWMAAAALEVPADLGVMAMTPVAVTKNRLSMAVVEQSFTADLSAISWKHEVPQGAV